MIVQVVDQFDDPLDVLLDGRHHVREHRRTTRTGDDEEVWESRTSDSQVGPWTGSPLIAQLDAVAASDLDTQQGASHRVEPSGAHQHVEFVRFLRRLQAISTEAHDRIPADVDQPNILPVECRVVISISADPLGANRKVLGTQHFCSRLVDYNIANALAYKFGRRFVGAWIHQQVAKCTDKSRAADL